MYMAPASMHRSLKEKQRKTEKQFLPGFEGRQKLLEETYWKDLGQTDSPALRAGVNSLPWIGNGIYSISYPKKGWFYPRKAQHPS